MLPNRLLPAVARAGTVTGPAISTRSIADLIRDPVGPFRPISRPEPRPITSPVGPFRPISRPEPRPITSPIGPFRPIARPTDADWRRLKTQMLELKAITRPGYRLDGRNPDGSWRMTRNDPAQRGGVMCTQSIPGHCSGDVRPVYRGPVTAMSRRYLGKAQVYDMTDELEQFEEAVDDAAIRPAHVRPRSRALSAAFERNWRNRAEKFISGPR